MTEKVTQGANGAWRVERTRVVKPVSAMSEDVQQIFNEVVASCSDDATRQLTHEFDQRLPRCGGACIRSAAIYAEKTGVHQPGYEAHCFPSEFGTEKAALDQAVQCDRVLNGTDGVFQGVMTTDRNPV